MKDILNNTTQADEEVVIYDGIVTIVENDREDGKAKAKVLYLSADMDEPVSLKDIAEKYPNVQMVIFDNLLNGKVYRYGNHEKGEWECVGTTLGYA